VLIVPGVPQERCGLHYSRSGCGAGTTSCGHSNELSGSITDEDHLPAERLLTSKEQLCALIYMQEIIIKAEEVFKTL
jgi:hypothetical protein